MGQVDPQEAGTNQACLHWLAGREGNSFSAVALKNRLCNSPCLHDGLATLAYSFRERDGKIIQS